MNALQVLSEVVGTVSIEDGLAHLEDGTTVDILGAFKQQEETLQALREVVTAFQTGTCYDTKNPYSRPYVQRALEAIKSSTGFAGSWMDANPYVNEAV